MNIVITLPHDLAQAIYDGEKTIELRKNFPMRLNSIRGRVFICEKGTKKVTGMFSIENYSTETDPSVIWQNFGARLAISKAWFDKYVYCGPRYYLWHIINPVKFAYPVPLSEVFGLAVPPQSYAYTAAQPYDVTQYHNNLLINKQNLNKRA